MSQHTEYPKFVLGQIVKDALEEATVRGPEQVSGAIADSIVSGYGAVRVTPEAIEKADTVEFIDRIELGPNSPVALIETRRGPGRPPKAK